MECDGVVWTRSADVTLCAARCTSDFDCSAGERCRVLGGAPAGAVFAEDIPDLVERNAAVVEAEANPEYDDPPTSDYTGDLQKRPLAPLLLCDPFHDELGAIPSQADLDAVAAE